MSASPNNSKRLMSLGAILMVLWLLLSGHYDALLISFGVISVLLVIWVAARMDVVDEEGHPIQLSLRAPVYFAYLFWEIIKSNIDVARRILSRGPAIDPRVITVRASQKTIVGRVTYANSITLTPGTVSIDLTEDRIRVHALSREGAESLQAGEMDRRVSRMENLD